MTTKKKPEGKRSVAEREGVANSIAVYLLAMLERQLDAGADEYFRTRLHLADLGREIARKVENLIERRSRRADEEEKAEAGATDSNAKPRA